MSKERELLRRALKVLAKSRDDDAEDLYDEIFDYFEAELEAEPVAWTSDFELKEVASNGYGYFSEPGDPRNNIPLYLHLPNPSPARKPMTEEEIDAGFRYGDVGYMNGFFEGVRFAEKHHGIEANPSDPDSIDLQSQCRGDKL